MKLLRILKKKALAASLIFAICFSCVATFSACSSYVVVGCIQKVREGEISMSYENFNGSRVFREKFEKGDVISVTVNTKKGKLSIRIEQENQEPIYSGNITQDFSFKVNVDEGGSYNVKLNAEDHKGSFSLTW